MLFRIINTDLILNGKILKENSVIEMTDQEFQKEKKYFGNYLMPFFDDTNTEKVTRQPITLNTGQNEGSHPIADSKNSAKKLNQNPELNPEQRRGVVEGIKRSRRSKPSSV